MTGPLIQVKLRLALDERLTVLAVEDGIEELLGFGAEDFLASLVSLKDRIHKDDADIAGILFSPFIEDKSGTFNIRFRHADGRIRCVRGQYKKEPASGGRGAVLDLLLVDAKSLYKHEDEPVRLTAIEPMMDIVHLAIHLKNKNYVFTGVNQQAMRCFAGPGGDRTEVLGKTDYDLFPEEYADIHYRLEKEVFAGKAVASETQTKQGLDGSMWWADILRYPIADESGEIIGLLGMVRDVTDRVDSQKALAEAE